MKTKKLTPRMQRVIDRLKAGDTLYYSTSLLNSGHNWFGGGEHETVRNDTLRSLQQRGLVAYVHSFPTGKVVLTVEGAA